MYEEVLAQNKLGDEDDEELMCLDNLNNHFKKDDSEEEDPFGVSSKIDKIFYRKPTVPAYQKAPGDPGTVCMTPVQYSTPLVAIVWVSGSWNTFLAATSSY